jgi:ABC-2 type transport system ATP-binding protein
MFHVKHQKNLGDAMEKMVIQVERLQHRYGDFTALHDLSFEVNQGEVFGLLGPNGAGKTTTIRLLNGMFEPSSGSLSVMGFDPATQGAQIRAHAGVLTETPGLYERLTANQNLRFFGAMAGLSDREIKSRSADILALFGLTARANDRTGTYSKGMKQRLALARAWLTRPSLLFLDEPTSGLDPEASAQVRELIDDVRRKEGTTVLICTHNLDEAQRLCDRLLIMRQGSLLAQGNLGQLRRLISPGLWLQVAFLQPFPQAASVLGNLKDVLAVEVVDDRQIRVEISSDQYVPVVVASLVQQGAQILRVQPQEISLEEVYLKLQNNGHENGGVQ